MRKRLAFEEKVTWKRGEIMLLSSLRRAGKTNAAPAAHVGSGRENNWQRALRNKYF
jgi:hypothetical protein